jgi:hypothetical protein
MAHDLLHKPDLPKIQQAVLHLVLSTSNKTVQLEHAQTALKILLSVCAEEPADDFVNGYLELSRRAVSFWQERPHGMGEIMDQVQHRRELDEYFAELLRETAKLSLLEPDIEMANSSGPPIVLYDSGTQVFDAHRSGRSRAYRSDGKSHIIPNKNSNLSASASANFC